MKTSLKILLILEIYISIVSTRVLTKNGQLGGNLNPNSESSSLYSRNSQIQQPDPTSLLQNQTQNLSTEQQPMQSVNNLNRSNSINIGQISKIPDLNFQKRKSGLEQNQMMNQIQNNLSRKISNQSFQDLSNPINKGQQKKKIGFQTIIKDDNKNQLNNIPKQTSGVLTADKQRNSLKNVQSRLFSDTIATQLKKKAQMEYEQSQKNLNKPVQQKRTSLRNSLSSQRQNSMGNLSSNRQSLKKPNNLNKQLSQSLLNRNSLNTVPQNNILKQTEPKYNNLPEQIHNQVIPQGKSLEQKLQESVSQDLPSPSQMNQGINQLNLKNREAQRSQSELSFDLTESKKSLQSQLKGNSQQLRNEISQENSKSELSKIQFPVSDQSSKNNLQTSVQQKFLEQHPEIDFSKQSKRNSQLSRSQSQTHDNELNLQNQSIEQSPMKIINSQELRQQKSETQLKPNATYLHDLSQELSDQLDQDRYQKISQSSREIGQSTQLGQIKDTQLQLDQNKLLKKNTLIDNSIIQSPVKLTLNRSQEDNSTESLKQNRMSLKSPSKVIQDLRLSLSGQESPTLSQKKIQQPLMTTQQPILRQNSSQNLSESLNRSVGNQNLKQKLNSQDQSKSLSQTVQLLKGSQTNLTNQKHIIEDISTESQRQNRMQLKSPQKVLQNQRLSLSKQDSPTLSQKKQLEQKLPLKQNSREVSESDNQNNLLPVLDQSNQINGQKNVSTESLKQNRMSLKSPQNVVQNQRLSLSGQESPTLSQKKIQLQQQQPLMTTQQPMLRQNSSQNLSESLNRSIGNQNLKQKLSSQNYSQSLSQSDKPITLNQTTINQLKNETSKQPMVSSFNEPQSFQLNDQNKITGDLRKQIQNNFQYQNPKQQKEFSFNNPISSQSKSSMYNPYGQQMYNQYQVNGWQMPEQTRDASFQGTNPNNLNYQRKSFAQKSKNGQNSIDEDPSQMQSQLIQQKQSFDSYQDIIKGKQCNVDLLKIFGVKNENDKIKFVKSKAGQRSFCRRNRETCCSTYEIDSKKDQFYESADKLRKMFEILEEILILFKGPAYKNIINLTKGDGNKCFNVLSTSQLYKGSKNIKDFEQKLPDILDEGEQLINDIEIYVKKNLWFYSNIICSICNPVENQFFQLNEAGSQMTLHISNCAEIMEMQEFEDRVVIMYNNFIKVFADIITCHYKLTEEEYKIDNINYALIDNRITQFQECYDNFDYESEDCQKICKSKSLFTYKFPIPFFKTISQALKVVYYGFTEGKDIAEYYKDIKNADYDQFAGDAEIRFYPQNHFYQKYKMDTLEYDLNNLFGVNIYSDHMSKKFINYVPHDKFSSLKTTVVLLVTSLLLIQNYY